MKSVIFALFVMELNNYNIQSALSKVHM